MHQASLIVALALLGGSLSANAFIAPGIAPRLRGGCASGLPRRQSPLGVLCSAASSKTQDVEAVRAKVDAVKSNAKENVPFDDDELDAVIASFRAAGGAETKTDLDGLRKLLASTAHQKHTEWAKTENSGQSLAKIVGTPDNTDFQNIFKRVLRDGNWNGASVAATARPSSSKPWAVLVTGVNGIRKTSTIYQPWFKQVLSQALAKQLTGEEDLPTGENSFFRQLDYIIATVANSDFRNLYELDDISTYAAVKDGIFARYRTVAEMTGALLVEEARSRRMNVMVETSGRDIGMFKYVDHFFPDSEYNKLVVHFTINDISFAEKSVDGRMIKEMKDGQQALQSGETDDIIQANAGGPYGSAVLRQVERESNQVWEKLQEEGQEVGKTWFKASLAVTASESTPWTVSAKTGGAAEVFEFTPLK